MLNSLKSFSSDAWSLGALDPTSGTATVLETTRVLGEMYRAGFRPRRSLMFCSWGAEEYGLLGSIEYVQVIDDYFLIFWKRKQKDLSF